MGLILRFTPAVLVSLNLIKNNMIKITEADSAYLIFEMKIQRFRLLSFYYLEESIWQQNP